MDPFEPHGPILPLLHGPEPERRGLDPPTGEERIVGGIGVRGHVEFDVWGEFEHGRVEGLEPAVFVGEVFLLVDGVDFVLVKIFVCHIRKGCFLEGRFFGSERDAIEQWPFVQEDGSDSADPPHLHVEGPVDEFLHEVQVVADRVLVDIVDLPEEKGGGLPLPPCGPRLLHEEGSGLAIVADR